MDATIILQELTRRKYPSGILTPDDFTGVLDAALREMQKAEPLVGFAKFPTQRQITDYFVFDPNDTSTHVPDGLGGYTALCANALNIEDVFWNPGGDWSSLNIFSPGWQMLSQMVLFTGSFFHQPSQMTVLRQKLDSWKRQFGDQGFEIIGEPGQTTSFLRIYPVPEEDGAQVVVQFSATYGVASIGSSWSKNFMMLVEALYCEALANYFSETAGVNLLGFTDSNSAMTYWNNKYKTKWERAQNVIFGPHGQVVRY